MKVARADLQSRLGRAVWLISYNADERPEYDAKKRPGAYFLLINTVGTIALARQTNPRPLTGIAPSDGSDVIVGISDAN